MDRIDEKRGIAPGILYLCATPIGNLEDMTMRCIRVLREVDLIAAEDTRNSIHLLNYFEIKTPMTSYHEHNIREKGPKLIRLLREGKNIALISDAGMPGISDPGEDLANLCHEEGITVTVVPGASACVSALAASGLPSERFVFEGFIPREKKGQRILFEELREETRTMLFYEAPHRLLSTLKTLFDNLGERKIGLCKELTKRYECVQRMTLSEAVEYCQTNPPKGEYVIVVCGKSAEKKEEENRRIWMEMPMEEHVQHYIQRGEEKKAAMKKVAEDRGITKREVYQYLLDKKG